MKLSIKFYHFPPAISLDMEIFRPSNIRLVFTRNQSARCIPSVCMYAYADSSTSKSGALVELECRFMPFYCGPNKRLLTPSFPELIKLSLNFSLSVPGPSSQSRRANENESIGDSWRHGLKLSGRKTTFIHHRRSPLPKLELGMESVYY